MTQLVRCVYEAGSSLCKGFAHIVLRDLTNYYYFKESCESDRQNELSSCINEFHSGPKGEPHVDSLLHSEETNNDAMSDNEDAKSVSSNKSQNYNKQNHNLIDREVPDNLNCSNDESYSKNALGENLEYNFKNKEVLKKDVAILKKEVFTNIPKNFYSDTLNGCCTPELKTSAYTNNKELTANDVICTISKKHSYTIQSADIGSSNLEEVTDEAVICEQINYLQGNDSENDQPNFKSYQAECSTENSISTGPNLSSDIKNTTSGTEISKQLDLAIENCCTSYESIYATTPNKEPALQIPLAGSKLFDKLSETTGLLESLSDIGSCDNNDWVTRFLSEEHEDSVANCEDEVVDCECSKMHRCLQVVPWDDEDELLSNEQLLSVDTGSVSDWLYRVSPAICLLPANDVIAVTPEEKITTQDEGFNHESKIDQNDLVVKTIYVNQWLINTDNFYNESSSKYQGSGDHAI